MQAKDPILIQIRRLFIPSLSGPETPRDSETKQPASEHAAKSQRKPATCQPLRPRTSSNAQTPQSGPAAHPGGCLPAPATPVGHRAGPGPQGQPRAVPPVCGGHPAGLERADLQGRLQRLICLLRHFAGGRRRKREFHLSPAIPPPCPQLPSCQELLINCCVFTPKGCCWGAFNRSGSAGSGGLRRLPPAKSRKTERGLRRPPTPAGEPGEPQAPPHGTSTGEEPLFRRSGAPRQLCKALGKHLGRREALGDGKTRGRGVRARSLGAKHPANFPLPIHQLATCSE